MSITDFGRAAATAAMEPPWDERSRLMAQLVPPGTVVFDFGAGRQALRDRLPPGCRYLPIDCIPTTPDTFVVDYNVECRFPEVDADVAFMSGFLEYVVDVEAFLRALAQRYPEIFVILSYAFGKEGRRRHASWLSDLGDFDQCLRFFGGQMKDLDQSAIWSEQVILTGKLVPVQGSASR